MDRPREIDMNPVMLEVIEYGQIKRMLLPSDWVEGERIERAVGNSSMREFNPSDNQHVRLFLFYRGHDLGKQAAELFRSALLTGDHELSRAEINALESVIGEKADSADFSITDARTVSLNGRRVLVVEGYYHPLKEESLSIFIRADWSGRLVQEIIFQAPTAQYAQYANKVRAAVQSIEWN